MKPLGLAVSIDGEPPVCIACAERCANDGGFAHLFWMANRPQRCDGTTSCPECGERMDGEKAQEAAVRVAVLLKANASRQGGAKRGGTPITVKGVIRHVDPRQSTQKMG